MKCISAIGSGIGIAPAISSVAIAADPTRELRRSKRHFILGCCARVTRRCHPQALWCSFFHLRTLCNNAGEGSVAAFDPVLDRGHRLLRADGFVSGVAVRRHNAVTTTETAAMLAPEAFLR
jgi:hypothetical protein